MKKIYKILIIFILLIVTFSVFYIFYYYKNTIIISTNNQEIRVNNFYKNAFKILPNDNIEIASNNYYIFDYYPKNNQFLIVIQNTDTKKAREIAENDLLTILGISKKNACKLNFSLTVPYTIDINAAGKEYGLSFCPTGAQLP